MHNLNRIEDALTDLRAGKAVVVVDDENRENEGDLIFAAEFADATAINFMVREARGLVCISMIQKRLSELGIEQMVSRDENDSAHLTPFSISVDAREEITTGISAADRAKTIERLISPKSTKMDFVRPGHMFPLAANTRGVLGRAGHTEAGVDLMKLAGLYPAAVICEIMNDDGSMARLPQLMLYAQKHQLKIISIEDLIHFRLINDKSSYFQSQATARLPTAQGVFEVTAYQDLHGREHLLLKYGNPQNNALLRIHSECLTGDIFNSLRCDCGEQLQLAQKKIVEHGSGLILYLRQEGRGIGLVNKIKTYSLQEGGMDTVEANQHLGFSADERNYALAAQILKDNGIYSVQLMTNNPDKVNGLQKNNIIVTRRIPHQVEANPENRFYLDTKAKKMKHILQIALIS